MCVRKDVGDIPEFYFDVKKKDLPECNLQSILLDDDQIENVDKYRINQKQIDLINLWDDLIKGLKCELERASKVEMYQNTRRHLEWQTYRGEDESMWNHIMQFCQSGSSQVNFSMSLVRRPVKQEKRKALFNRGEAQGVFARSFTSSKVR